MNKSPGKCNKCGFDCLYSEDVCFICRLGLDQCYRPLIEVDKKGVNKMNIPIKQHNSITKLLFTYGKKIGTQTTVLRSK